MRLLRAAERVAVPWKNGGGVTREVAAYPPGAGIDDFEWRISLADVAVAGPFSSFAGIDRVLTVLEGRLLLRFADGRVEDLAPGAPCAFSGDAVVHGTPLEGRVRDLNVMTRRDAWTAKVSPWHPNLPVGDVRIAIATSAAAGIGPLDALVLDANEIPPSAFQGYLVRLDATAQNALGSA